MKTLLVFLLLFSLQSPRALAGETVIKDSQGMDCYVYTPDPLVEGKTYQLIVGVHGARGNGKGAGGMAGWANRGDVIVIGPSFDTKSENPFQNGNGAHAEKLLDIVKTLRKTHSLNEKLFLHGFSAGSQFVHRFAMLYPQHVCGVSAHSGGTWATDGYGEIRAAAKKIPFAISCGEKDTGKSFPEAPYGRLEWFGRFRDELEKGRFTFIAASWPGVGHSPSPGVTDFAKQCFQIATGLPGENATTTVAISDQWKNLDKGVAPAPARPQPAGAPPVDDATLDQMAQAAFAKADAAEIPKEQLIGFMKRYPPILWKDKPGSGKLLQQCESAAKEWMAAAKTKGLWTDEAKKEFLRFTEGIEMDTAG